MKRILTNLGCGAKEIHVYMDILELGVSNATEISRKAELPRQTVYYILDALIKKGLIEQTDKRGVKQFFADPSRIKALIDEKKRELEDGKRELDLELTRLLSKNSSGVELPKIQFFQGREGLKRLLSSILDLYKKGKYKTFKGYAINEYYPGLEEFISSFIRERHRLGVQSRLFVPKDTDFNKIGGQDTFGRKMKALEIEYHKAAFYIVGNRIYLFSYKDGVGIMVENNNLANLFRDIFDNQWDKN